MALDDLGVVCPCCKSNLRITRRTIIKAYTEIMAHTQIPEDELKVFESLTNIRVVFDVGARDDVDYLILRPDIELHAFEPSPEWFQELKDNVGDTPNVYLNNVAVGAEEGFLGYNKGSQAMTPTITGPDGIMVPVKRLDDYIKEHNVREIDFLKMDVEGYEPQVVEGLGEMRRICRYIQYEQGQNSSKTNFDRLLPESEFDLYYIGYRNVLAVRKGEKMPWIPDEPGEGGQPVKDESNYLHVP